MAEQDLRQFKYFPIQPVEPLCQITGDFHMLFLVITDGNIVGLIQQDICRHQGRIGQKAGRDGIAPLGSFVLVLGHPFQFAYIGRRNHDPAELYVFRYFRLYEQCRFLRVQAGSDINSCQLTGPFMEKLRILWHRNSMLVDNAVITFIGILQFRKITQCAKIIS